MSPLPVTPTILLVDDEPSILAALRRSLGREGYRLLTAAGGAEALAVLEQETVDLLISDIDMPRMSGLELLALVRARWPAVIRIVLTGGLSLETAVKSINEGEVHRYLTKPWNREALLETVRSTIARLSALRAPAREEAFERAQAALRQELRQEFPGILEVERSGGAYVLDDERVAKVLRALDREGRGAFVAAALVADDDATRVSPSGLRPRP